MAQRSALSKEVNALVKDVRAAARVTWRATLLLWTLEIADALVFGGRLDGLGIRPLDLGWPWGLLLAPLLHAGFWHLFANTVAGVPLAMMSMERKRQDFFVVCAVSALTSGLGAFFLGGAGTVHLGASGVIFGLLGFVLARGFFERRVGAMLLSVAAFLGFGGSLVLMIPGLFPGVSWQAHLFGFLGGVLVARTLGGRVWRR